MKNKWKYVGKIQFLFMYAIQTFLFLIKCYCNVAVLSVRTFWYQIYACRLNINGYIWKNISRKIDSKMWH